MIHDIGQPGTQNWAGYFAPALRIRVVAMVCFVTITTQVVFPATIVVDTTNDELNSDGNCSLREAIASANMDVAVDGCAAGSGYDQVVFDPIVTPGVFLLTLAGAGEDAGATGDLDVVDDLMVLGADPSATIIDGAGLDRVFDVISTATLRLDRVTIQRGVANFGGAARNSFNGVLALTHSILTDNSATIQGGGVFNSGDGLVTITESTLAGNSALAGGGIANSGRGAVVIASSTVSENFATVEGGGVRANGDGPFMISNCTFAGNNAGLGGGIRNALGEVSITASTFAQNVATREGGGISTLNGTTELWTTIIADNTAPIGPDCASETVSLGHNLFGDTSDCIVPLLASDLVGDAGLDAFAHGGAPGEGHFPLLATSWAIDSGGADCPPTDQLGTARPRDGDGDGEAVCDIGAFEYQLPVILVQIDIKPGGFPNSVNPDSRGVIPVAILGSDTIDVTNIDVTTLGFGSNLEPPAHDLTDSFTYLDHLQDVNLDGYTDLVTHYRTRNTGIVCGDASATLTGETIDGQPIEGSDSISTVGCRRFGRPGIWMRDERRVVEPRGEAVIDLERK